MNRVFRGALFPILIVIVLAFFVSKLVSPGSSSAVQHNYQSFTTQDIPRGNVQSFTVDPANNAINVTLNDHTKYSVGYDPGTTMLPTLITQRIRRESSRRGEKERPGLTRFYLRRAGRLHP